MSSKKTRKSRKSKGIVGRSQKARTSVGMSRLLNQIDAFRAGKNVTLKVPMLTNPSILVKTPASNVWRRPKS